MTNKIKIGLVGDYSEEVIAHKAIPVALKNAGDYLKIPLESEWLPTESLNSNSISYDAFWFTPASPYKDHIRVLKLIQHARQNQIPTLGTCGGCQHILLEWALNVLGWKNATHAEFQEGGRQVINPLVCSLSGARKPLEIITNTQLSFIYEGADDIVAEYQCGFGINPEYRDEFFDDLNLKANSLNEDGDVRSFELVNHPMMIATMFQPEREALKGGRVPLAEALLEVAYKEKGA